MSRTLTLLAALLVVIAGYMLIRNRAEDNKTVLPTPETPKEEPLAKDSSSLVNWREFSFQPAHFKVLLPGIPQHVSDTVTDPKTQKPRKYETFAAASENGAAFMVNAITFSTPLQAQASEESLKEAVTEMLARNKENKLNEMKMSTFRGSPALDFSMVNGDVLIEGKVLTHNDTMYILSMIHKQDQFNKSELNFFINSFEFDDTKEGSEQKNDVPTQNPATP